MPLDSDSEDPEPEEELLLMKTGAYVVVKYANKKTSSMFVGQITELDREEDLVTTTFLKRKGASFIRPEPEDVDVVREADMVKFLPAPSTVGGTARACLRIFFDDTLDDIKE